MLVREGQFLDLQVVRLADEMTDEDAEGVCSQLGIDASAQS